MKLSAALALLVTLFSQAGHTEAILSRVSVKCASDVAITTKSDSTVAISCYLADGSAYVISDVQDIVNTTKIIPAADLSESRK